MTLSLSNFLICTTALTAVLWTDLASAATITYDWNVTWTTGNPDGLAERPVVGINNQWPLPLLNITKNDRVVVYLHNQLGNETTSMHFHGLFQNGTNDMDGPVGVTQCDVAPGQTMVYNFTIDQPGTYWYHSHSSNQYPDGARGQFVVYDPENPYYGQFDEEVPLTISDWYHDQMPTLMQSFVNVNNPTGAEPIPNSALMNDTQNLTISVKPSQTYFFRLSNVGAFAGQYFWIEEHTMKIIEVDGVYTEPYETNMIYLGVAQRYGFLVTAKNDTTLNFPIVSSMDTSLFDKIPSTLNWNVTGWLVYNDAAEKPAPALVDNFNPLDDFQLVAQDGLEVFDHVDYSFNLDLVMQDLGNGVNYAFFNDITYVQPKVPSIYTALTTGGNATNPAVYGGNTNAHIFNKNDVIELVLNNYDTGKHPFHLHGHNFQVVVSSPADWGPYDSANQTYFPPVPVRRDTLVVQPQGHFVVRFRADNPGVWFFHCHIQWHLATGLAAVFVEDPLTLQQQLTVPSNHYDMCRATGTLYAGNAAGNTEDVLDLAGENTSVAPLPAGFTARGITALVFSCISAVLGMAMIAWYGAAPLSAKEIAQTKKFIAKAGGDLK